MDAVNPNLTAWLFVLAAGVNSCAGNLLLKKARLVSKDPGLIAMLLNPWFIGGLLFYGINVVLFAKALDRLPVSVAYPALAGCGFALLSLAAGFFFGERLGWNQILGTMAILVGILLLSRQ